MLKDLTRVGLGRALAGVLLVVAYTTWRIWDQGSRDDARPADAIVVLGAAQYNGVPSPIYRARLDHAIDLFEEGVAPLLVMTGGKLPGDQTTEADAGRAYAIAHGVPPRRSSSRTRAGRRWSRSGPSAPMLDEHGLGPAVFVSDRTHMLRVLRIARDQGIEAFGLADPDEPDRRQPARSGCGRRSTSSGALGPLLPRRHRTLSEAAEPSRLPDNPDPENRPGDRFSLLARGILHRILAKTPRPRGSVRIPPPDRAPPPIPAQ